MMRSIASKSFRNTLQRCATNRNCGGSALSTSTSVSPFHHTLFSHQARMKSQSATTASVARQESSSPTQRDLVHSIMSSENVYNADILEKEVHSFFEDLDLPMTYYLKFSSQQIANHIHAMIAAKEMAKSSGREELEFTVEGRDHAMFVCALGGDSMLRMEQQVGNYIQSTPEGMSCSVFSFHSKRTAAKGSSAAKVGSSVSLASTPTMLYIATRDAFIASNAEAAETDDISVLATKEFLSNRTAEVRSGYQEVLRVMNTNQVPVFHNFSSANGHTHFTFAARKSGSSLTDAHNTLPLITELASTFNLSFENKVVETFANGTAVFTYHAPREFASDVMEKFLFSLEQLLFTPPSLRRALSNTATKFDPSALLYLHNAVTFAEYFVSQHSDEYAALLVETAQNPRANFHLCNLQKKLIMDSVTYTRIVETIVNYSGLAFEIYEDFVQKTTVSSATVGTVCTSLLDKIRKQVLNALDLEILQRFLIFNSVIRRTNFHKARKPAVCLQLDARFLKGTPFASQMSPVHCVFQSIGVGHLGFLTMRSSISRCSLDILMPATLDEEKRLRSELYFINDVSSTLMQAKTKDGPESGSGCTVLLNHRCAHERKALAFQFVSSILNVLAEEAADATTNGPKSFVFWGPGANAHDLMDDITKIAHRVQYPIARAIAAGKSREFGGITDAHSHSVGRLEIERLVYEKQGLEPSTLTKIITGSIHEVRTLDELIASKEKVLAIVDRHGVLYDEHGLNKEQLIKLGRDGRSILHYEITPPSVSSRRVAFLISRDQRNFMDPFYAAKVNLLGKNATTTTTTSILPTVTSGDIFCEEFLAHPNVHSDVLVLCDKRRSPICRYNVKNFVNVHDGTLKYKILFEAIDLSLSEDTRHELERLGVLLFKDTIMNKGTVLRASFEVIAALAFTSEEFQQHMCAASSSSSSAFYNSYTQDIMEIIRTTAQKDTELLSREYALTQQQQRDVVGGSTTTAAVKTRSQIINEISKKVDRLRQTLIEEKFYEEQGASIHAKVLTSVLPNSIVAKLGIEVLMERLPKEFVRTLFVKAVANEYVRKYGLAQDEFNFYEFVKNIL